MSNTNVMLDADACYQALRTHDARFDGTFFVGVSSTGIYCRPVCPAKTPFRKNCTFHASAASAERAGFRPCLRCRPELAPGKSNLEATSQLARQAYRRIQSGYLDENSVPELAAQLGVSDRHLRRVMESEFGAGPQEIAQTRRLLFSKQLLTDTNLPIGEIAFAAGFSSLRRFNDAFSLAYRMSPRDIRRRPVNTDISIPLTFEGAYAWDRMLNFWRLRALKGVEMTTEAEYRRLVKIQETVGTIGVSQGEDHLQLKVSPELARYLPQIIRRVRRQFDLNVDIDAVQTALGPIAQIPGLRLPVAFDPFESAVRTIIGQQVSVAGATTITGRLIAALGEPHLHCEHLTRLFPTPGQLSEATVSQIASLGMPGKRAETIISFAAFARDGGLTGPTPELEDLIKLPGIGPWTAEYIRMRCFGWPDCFPAGDLGLLKALGTRSILEATQLAENWCPWRSYAAMHLWNQP